MKKTRVVIVITKMELGGAQQVALETACRLDPAEFEVTLIAGRGGMLDAQAAAGTHFISTPLIRHAISPVWDLAACLWLAAYFLKNRVQVVHTHSSKAGLLGRAAAWLAGVPSVVHTVHGWPFHDFMPSASRSFYAGLERILAGITDRLVAVSQAVADTGLARRIGRPGQYQVIRAAVDLKAWSRRPAPGRVLALRKELGLPASGPVVGTLANCKPQKNPLGFVRVAAEVIRKVPSANFIYVGDGPQKVRAEALAESLGLKDKVHFLGWRQDAPEIAACFDVFLLASLWEGLPCVFPQARALGLPIVATAVGGASEGVREGVDGFLCQPLDYASLADRVSVLLRDRKLAAKMGRQGKGSLGKEWSLESMVDETARLYRAVAA